MNKVWILCRVRKYAIMTVGHVAFWNLRENDPSTKSSLLHFTKSGCTAVLILWKPNSAWKKKKVIDFITILYLTITVLLSHNSYFSSHNCDSVRVIAISHECDFLTNDRNWLRNITLHNSNCVSHNCNFVSFNCESVSQNCDFVRGFSCNCNFLSIATFTLFLTWVIIPQCDFLYDFIFL